MITRTKSLAARNVVQTVRKATLALNRAGLGDLTFSDEDGRQVITVTSSQEMISANIRTIVDSSQDGILIRCRTRDKKIKDLICLKI